MFSVKQKPIPQYDYRVLLFGCLVLQLGIWWVVSTQTREVDHNRSLLSFGRRLSAVDGLEAGARGTDPPQIKSRIYGDIPEYTWARAIDRRKACSSLRNYMHKPSAEKERAQPLLVRQAVGWPALQLWNFSSIANLNLSGDVVASPTFNFYYCDPGEMKEFVKKWGASKAPSILLGMASKEAIMRMQKSSNYSSVVYPEKEEYYWRTLLDDYLLKHVNLDEGPFSCLVDEKGWAWDLEDPRIWVSPRGGVSPLHFDSSQSCLIQIRGRKLMLLYDSDDLKSLHPYPDKHILRRRLRVDPVAPDYEKYPSFENVKAGQAIIRPGDVICFPGRWPHYTASLDPSISVTIRFQIDG